MPETHTPGPYDFRTFDGKLPIVMRRKMPHGEADTFYTTLFNREGSQVVVLDWGYGKKTDEANARLFSAAPELLEALQVLGSSGDPGYCFCLNQEQIKNGHTGECKQANAAISKALNLKGNENDHG